MSKRLVYISNSRMPATLAHGLQVMQMCGAFAQNGYEVELYIPRRVNPVKDEIFSYYGVSKNFSISRIWCLDLIFWNNKNIFFWIQTVTFLFFTRIVLFFKTYDVLYTREQAVGLFWKNFILEIHALPKVVRPFHTKIWAKAKLLVVLTPFIKEKMVALGVPSEKIVVEPDSVDLEKFDVSLSKIAARDMLHLPQDKKIIGYVGMLRTVGMEKGIDTAILAMQKTNNVDTRLVLVGGSPQDIAYYKEMSDTLGVAEKVFFVGRVPHMQIPVYLKAFDVLIAPFPKNEHYSFYMSPLKVFEYMASKRPIISTHLPSLEYILGAGEALLVTPGDVGELAEAVEKILEDDSLAENLSQKAFESVQKYTWIKRAYEILERIQ